MAHTNVTEEELAELIGRTAEAASALIRGDVRTYLTLVPHAEDYTLMDPFGGEPTRGFDASSESLEAMERFFQGARTGCRRLRAAVCRSWVQAEQYHSYRLGV